MKSKRAFFRINPAVAAAALFVALAAGSLSVSALSTSQSVAGVCQDDGDAISGTKKGEVIVGTSGDDVILGGKGRDKIKGRGGDDVICGGGGNDVLRGGDGDDVIAGGYGDDKIKGGPGEDDLSGGAGFDRIFGGPDDDVCDGEQEKSCNEATPVPSPTTSAPATPTATPSEDPTATPSTAPTTSPEPTKPPPNVAPTAADDSYSTDEDQTRNVAAPGVLANDSDPEGELLFATLVTGPADGTVTLAPNGGFSYVPDPDFNGTDSFTYTADDSSRSSAPATVTITVASIPDAPVAISQSVSGDEDSPLTLTFLATDPDGPSPAVFKITSLPANGQLRDGAGPGGTLITGGALPFTLTGNQATFVPDADWNGNDDFQFKANDGAEDSATATASMWLQPVNDTPHDISLSNSSVDEEQQPGVAVGTLSASDVDAGDTHTFTFATGAGDTDNSKFSIVNGVLKTAAVLDFEAGSPLSIRVRTDDAGGLATSKQFSITLIDVNDPPVVPDASLSLPENSPNGTSVGTAAVTDQDAGQSHAWSITGGNSDDAFAINGSTGEITVAKSSVLDFEDVQQWVLTVRAVDDGTPAKSDNGSITIDLTNVNEAPTDILLSGSSVAENEPTGTAVGNLASTDPDAGDTHSFSLAAGAGDGDNGKFQITNGILETAQSFDFETQGPFSVRIRTTDLGGLNHEETFSISVTDANDAPTDLDLSSTSVAENASTGTTVGNLSTTDPDAGDTPSYSLVAGTGDGDNGKFTIDGGALKTDQVFDFETQGPFSVRIRTTDTGGLQREESFSISVTDVNEVPTDLDLSSTSVAENASTGTTVGTLSTTDPDAGDTASYSLVAGTGDGDNGKFTIDGGALKTDQVFDFETQGPFSVRIRSTDTGGLQREETFSISVTDVNEVPTDLNLSNTSVAENESSGADVGNLSTTDPDAGDGHTYSLATGAGDGDNGKFQLTNGVLETAQSFDFETQGPFSVRIRTTDTGGLHREETFSISVTDANDAPVMNAATFAVDENAANGTLVGTPSSSDEDAGDSHTYAITGGNTGGAFEIDQTTWNLKVADTSALDFETNPTFALTIKVTDDGTPAKDDSETITVNLNNMNEVPVVNAATLSLAENSPNGTSVGTATASDPDAGHTQTWAITGGNTGGAFQINSSSGEITVADVNDVDFETNPSFSLTVEATDNGVPPLTGSNTITVDLTNVNESPTDISVNDLSVAENASLNTVVGTISGTDPDAGDSSTLVFSKASGAGDTDNARFNVGPSNSLRTSEVFDKETQGPFSIRLRATDGGALTYEEQFTVTIDDVNEAPDVDAATFSLDENSANGTSVGTATFTDQDAGQDHTFAITGGNTGGAFQINQNTGAITVADKDDVDYEANHPFALTVQVTDNGTPALDDTGTITVNLNDLNDAPVVNAATLSIAENSANGASAGTATATDQDSPAQTLTFAITSGNTGGAFQIDPSTGEITVADTNDLDFETTPSFPLTVRATDDGAGTLSGSNTVTVNLTNVNEKPVITSPSTVNAQYGVAKPISGISVSDPDSGNGNISMTLGVLDGTLDLDDTVANGLGSGDVTGNGSDSLVLTGTQTEINNTLGAAGGLTYTSDSGFAGLTDTLAIVVNDGGSTGSGTPQADSANVTIQFNAPPVATDQTVTTNEDTEKTVTLAGTDTDGDPLTFKITSLPATGKLHEGTSSAGTEITSVPHAFSGDKVTYVPPANQNGLALETFQFKANDGSADSSAGTVTVDVTAVDDLPVAVNDSPTVTEDSGANTIAVLANDTDVDGGPMTIASKTNGTNGTVAITNAGADLTYTPDADYCNNPPTVPVDVFTYTLNGGSVGTVSVTVTCVDDLPVAVDNSKTMDEDSTSAAATTIDVLANDTDVDGGPMTIASKTNGTNGTVAITNAGADLTYTPAANYCNTQLGGSPDTFTYTLNGGSSATVTVTVTCVDDAPVAVADSATVLEDANATTIDVLDNDTDVDAGPMFVDAKTNSSNGGTVAITNSGADLTYAPAANYCNDPELQPAGGSLSETFTYTLNGGSVGTVTMTVTCVNDPPTADTENLNGNDSALSNFRLDNGTNTAGLDIAPATLHNVLAGDTDPEGDTVSLIAGADCTGASTGPFTCLTDGYDPDGVGGSPALRGTVTLEADGDFHYTPAPGHIGSDSFDYRVSDGQAANSEATGTVNINVAGPTVWFVDDTAGAGGNGTSTAPFQGLAPLTTAGGSNHLDDANDSIFVYEGTYTSGIVLENGQKLLGHPHSLDVNDTAGRTHTDLVSSAGTAPAISHAANTVVTLGSGNELQDLALGDGSISLSGTGVGTATVRDTSINTTGKALDVNGGTLDMVFSTLTSNGSGTEAIKLNNAAGSLTANGGTLQNAANAVVDINGASQDVTIAGNISDGAGKVISITGTTGGTKDFNGTVTGTSGGTVTDPRINLANNAGSVIRFDNDLSLNTTTAPAFSATGGGTIHVTSDDNVLNTSTGTPLNVVNTTIGAGDLIFDSISSNGAPNGIVLDNTGNTGNLQVTGNPGADTNEGGTIAGTTGGDAATNQCVKPAGRPTGIGILLKDTNGVILNDMVVNGSSNFGLLAHDVNGFTLDDSTFSGIHGTNEGQDEGSAMFCDLTGSASISDSIIGGGYESSLKVVNGGGTLDRLTVSNTDLATHSGSFGDDAFHASATAGTFRVTVNGGSNFTAAGGDLFQYFVAGTTVGDVVVQNNVFENNYPTISSGGGGVTINPGGAGSNPNVTYNVSNNDFQDSRGPALALTTGGLGSSGATGTYVGTVANNTIGNAGEVGSGASDGSSGISFHHIGNGTHKVSITGNTIKQYTSSGIRMIANGGNTNVRATILGNTINEPANNSVFAGIAIEPGTSISPSTMCLDLGATGQQNSLSNSSPVGGTDVILFPDGTTTVNLPGYVGPSTGAAAAAAVTTFLTPKNSGDGVPSFFVNDAAGVTYGNGEANCL